MPHSYAPAGVPALCRVAHEWPQRGGGISYVNGDCSRPAGDRGHDGYLGEGDTIRSFFRYVVFEAPAHAAQIQRVLAIPATWGKVARAANIKV
jgi:hypothetical protein